MSLKQNDVYQEQLTQNVIQFNLDLKAKKNVIDEHNFSYNESIGYSCIICGAEDLSPAIVRFYDFDVTRLKCFSCQDNNK